MTYLKPNFQANNLTNKSFPRVREEEKIYSISTVFPTPHNCDYKNPIAEIFMKLWIRILI